MKFFGKKSLSSFMHKMAILSFLVTVLLVILFTVQIIPVVAGKLNAITTNEISSGIFSIQLKSPVIDTYNSIYRIVLSVLALMTAVLSIKLFDNFRKDIIFNIQNVKLIKTLAKIKIVGGIIAEIVAYYGYKLAVTNVKIEGVRINYNIFDGTTKAFHIAIIYFLVAFALEQAIKYKEENELTV